VSTAAVALLRKAHIYELLANLQQAVDKVVASTPVKSSSALPDDFWNINGGEEETSKASGTEDDEFGLDEAMQRTREPRGVREGGDSNGAKKEKRQRKKTDQSVESMEGVESQEAVPQPIPVEIMRKISSCLDELRKCLEQAPHTTVQAPLKSFPTKVKCFPDSEGDYFPALVRMFQARRLLECLLVLVSAPSTTLEISVFAGVRGLLLHFMASQQGLLFLSTSPSVMNSITRALTQAVVRPYPWPLPLKFHVVPNLILYLLCAGKRAASDCHATTHGVSNCRQCRLLHSSEPRSPPHPPPPDPAVSGYSS